MQEGLVSVRKWQALGSAQLSVPYSKQGLMQYWLSSNSYQRLTPKTQFVLITIKNSFTISFLTLHFTFFLPPLKKTPIILAIYQILFISLPRLLKSWASFETENVLFNIRMLRRSRRSFGTARVDASLLGFCPVATKEERCSKRAGMRVAIY